MLTADDKEEIRRLVGEVIAACQPSSAAADPYAGPGENIDARLNFMAQFRELIFSEGFTELTFTNPETGEKRVRT
jgi:hypothetical protein